MEESASSQPPAEPKQRLKRSYKHSSYACEKCRQAHRRCKHDPKDDPNYDGRVTKRTRRRKKSPASSEANGAQVTPDAMQPMPQMELYSGSAARQTSASPMHMRIPDFSATGPSPLTASQPQTISWLDPVMPVPVPGPATTHTSLPSFDMIAGYAQSPPSRSSSMKDADFLEDKTTFDDFDLPAMLIEFFSLSESDEKFWRTTGKDMISESATLKHAGLGLYLLHYKYETRQAEGLEHIDKALKLLNKQLAIQDPAVWQMGLFASGLLASAQFCAGAPMDGARLHMEGLLCILAEIMPRIHECRPEFQKMIEGPHHCNRISRSAVKEYKIFVQGFREVYPDIDMHADHMLHDPHELLFTMIETLSCFFDLSGFAQRKEALTLVLRLQRTLVTRRNQESATAQQRMYRPLIQEAIYDLLFTIVYPSRGVSILRSLLASKMYDAEAACGTMHFARLALAAMDRVIYEPAAHLYAQ